VPAPTEIAAGAPEPPGQLLELVLSSLSTAVGVLRAPDFRYELDNPACQVIVPGPSFVGRTFAEIAPELAEAVVPLMRRVVETGEPFRAVDMPLPLASGPGGALEERFFTFSYRRLPADATGWPAVLATVEETTEQVRARRALEASLATERAARAWLERFRRLSGALAAARTGAEVASATLDHGLAAFGADAGVLVAPDGLGQLELVVARGYLPAEEAPWTRFPADADVPVAEAIRTGQPVFLEDRAAVAARYPALAAGRAGWRGLASLPLAVEGAVLGAIGLSFRAPRTFDAAERARLEWLAQKCAQAMERARLSDAERQARRWLQRLQSATAAASAAATPAAVADEVIRAGLHALGAATVAVFTRAADGTLHAMASHGLAPDELDLLDPMPVGAPLPAADAARLGQPVYLGSPGAQAARYPALAPLASGDRQRALAALPMLARGQLVGVLRVGFLEPRRFDDAERAFLEALASQAGLALERARGYEAEQRARAEASRIGALQEQLMAVVGHDLRTPLTAVTMSAGLLLRRGGLAPGQVEAVARIAQGAGRMAGLIRDLLDFSRLRQGLSLSLRAEPADLVALAREAIQEHEAAGAPRRVSLEAAGDPALHGDAARLAQVLANLVGNALQHGAGSPVRVTVDGRADDLLLRVQNGGPPIPPALLPSIFEPFRGGGDGAGGSVGLGLFIVREIVRAHGGRIEVRSAEAEGTCFSVRLPRRAPSDPSRPVPTPAPAPPGSAGGIPG